MMRAEVSLELDGGDEISPLIYGQYVEHVADCVYPAIHDPESPESDEHGLRRDVQRHAAEMGVPVVRWPGGCFADVYHWQDGIGPREQRPLRRNWHWGGLEPNHFGTDEFLAWCENIGAQPYVNLNLGTGTLDEALRWMDYCVGTEATEDVRRRRRNGRREPYDVRLWGIGNETWGPWEAGTTDAEHYARLLANWADFASRYQQDASLLGVGSAEGADPAWDRAVLDVAGDRLAYLTQHTYGYSVDRETGAEYLNVAFTPVYVEARLRAMAEVIASSRAAGRVRIALDEWNIRHFEPDGTGGYRLNRASPRTVQDAVFAAGVFNAMIRMSPMVGMANYVFLVNGNGVLLVRGPHLVRTTLYHVFRQYRQWMRGTALAVDVRAPGTALPRPQADRPGHAPVPDGLPARADYLDAAAARAGKAITVSLVNRHPDEAIEVSLLGSVDWHRAWTLTHGDVYATNDVEHPDRVVPEHHRIEPGRRSWRCPPHSITLLRGHYASPFEHVR